MPKMEIRCCHCQKTIGFKTCDPAQVGYVSHGICIDCIRKHYPEDADEILGEETITVPAKQG